MRRRKAEKGTRKSRIKIKFYEGRKEMSIISALSIFVTLSLFYSLFLYLMLDNRINKEIAKLKSEIDELKGEKK